MHRLLSFIQYLARHNIALRGTAGHEQLGNSKNGPFLALVELLASYDVVLSEHVKKVKCKQLHVHYLGKHIQNELLELAGKKILGTISHSVRQDKYYSMILDCTPDCSHQEQLTMLLRCVNVVADAVQIEEHFVGFIAVEQTGSASLTEVILNKLEQLELSIHDCRSQGYNNGANMTGRRSSVQQRVLSVNPNALFMPCSSHSLNLVLCDSAKSCPSFFTFSGVLQTIYVALSSSVKRWKCFKRHCKNTFKHPCNTRWESKISSVATLHLEYFGVFQALKEISLDISDCNSLADIQGLLTEMKTFEFLLSTVIWYDVLTQTRYMTFGRETSGLEGIWAQCHMGTRTYGRKDIWARNTCKRIFDQLFVGNFFNS